MAIAVVQFAGASVANNGASTVCSLTSVVAGNAILIVALSFNGTYTVTDSNGTPVKDVTWSGTVSSYRWTIWSVLNCNAGTHNFALSGGSTNSAIHAYEVSGLATSSAFDKTAGQNAAGGAVSFTTPTLSVADEIVLAVCHCSTETISAGSGFTANETSEVTFGHHIASEYKIVAATTAVTVTFNRSSGTTPFSAGAATYRVPGVAGVFTKSIQKNQAVNRASTY